MTNAISRDAANHFAHSWRFKRSNTEVTVEVHQGTNGPYDITRLILHGNVIACAISGLTNGGYGFETFSITTAGWPTRVTKARLNALSGKHADFPFFQVKTLGGELLLDDRPWNGEWKDLITEEESQ